LVIRGQASLTIQRGASDETVEQASACFLLTSVPHPKIKYVGRESVPAIVLHLGATIPTPCAILKKWHPPPTTHHRQKWASGHSRTGFSLLVFELRATANRQNRKVTNRDSPKRPSISH
jgi:hypothetical protein